MSSKVNGKSAEFVEIKKARQDIASLQATVDGLENNVEAALALPATMEKPDSPNMRIVRIKFYNYKVLGAGMENLVEAPKIAIVDQSGSPVNNGAGGTGGGVPIDGTLSMQPESTGVYYFDLQLDGSVSNLDLGTYTAEATANYGTIGSPINELFAKSFEVVELSGLSAGFASVIQAVEDNRGMRQLMGTVDMAPFADAGHVLSAGSGAHEAASNTTVSDSYEIVHSYEIAVPEDSGLQDSEVLDGTVEYELSWKSVISAGAGNSQWYISPTNSLTGAVAITDEVVAGLSESGHFRQGSIKRLPIQTKNWWLILAGKSGSAGDTTTLKLMSDIRIKFTYKAFAI